MEKAVKVSLIILAVCASLLFIGIRSLQFGLNIHNCVYSEEKIPLEKTLEEGTITTIQDVYAVPLSALGGYRCLPTIGKLSELIGPGTQEVLQNSGIPVQDYPILKSGSLFSPISVIAVHAHGTMGFFNPIPFHYIVLQDSEGQRYVITPNSLGINGGSEIFLKFDSSSQSFYLVPDNFNVPGNQFDFYPKSMLSEKDSAEVERVITVDAFNKMAQSYETDYDLLRKNCNANPGNDQCCLDSVDHMQKNNYPIGPGKCREAEKSNSLPCFTSITWCEPI